MCRKSMIGRYQPARFEFSDEEHKDTDHLYEDMGDGVMYNQGHTAQHEYERQKEYDDAMNGPSQDTGNRKQAVHEFRICYARPKYPRRNLTTERLARPKKPAPVNNPFMYSDFRGMIHADYQEAMENLDVPAQYSSTLSINKGLLSTDGKRLGTTQTIRDRRKFSASVKEMFPMPEFNTYLTQPTKKKDRLKQNKPHTAGINFRSGMSEHTKVL